VTTAKLDVGIPYERFTLPNGMDLLVHEDHDVPLVAVNMWYHVGSKDERPGRTGLAHLFEHIMFEGSQHVGSGEFDTHLELVGGVNNGSTTTDRTNYWITVPTGALELALWLESDRMGFLLEAITQEKLDVQRDVVKNERRQSYENRPYGLAFETMLEALYPEGHPYRHPVIGSMHDLSAATLDDAKEFFRTYYAPGNASLAVAGDVSTDEVVRLVERYFGGIPNGPAVPGVSTIELRLPEERRPVLEDRVHLPRVYMAWRSARQYTEGDADMEVLAGVLGGGKTSRLYKRLVYEERIAQDVSAFQNGSELDGSFFVIVTAKPGTQLTALERGVREEVDRLARKGVTGEERARTMNHIESEMVRALERVGGFGGKADRLNEYLTFAGDAGYVTRDLERYRRVTGARAAAAARSRLMDVPGVVLSVVPHGRRELAAAGGWA
jgi:zinc protease